MPCSCFGLQKQIFGLGFAVCNEIEMHVGGSDLCSFLI
uniref:Uncharacterized protein n=1 Tax=Arundo donax TaxID=35708 RepID=A0A0A8Y1Q7_ARUDO